MHKDKDSGQLSRAVVRARGVGGVDSFSQAEPVEDAFPVLELIPLCSSSSVTARLTLLPALLLHTR